MTPEDRDMFRVLLSAVAMHALLSTMKVSADGSLMFNGDAVADAAVKQADQLLTRLSK